MNAAPDNDIEYLSAEIDMMMAAKSVKEFTNLNALRIARAKRISNKLIESNDYQLKLHGYVFLCHVALIEDRFNDFDRAFSLAKSIGSLDSVFWVNAISMLSMIGNNKECLLLINKHWDAIVSDVEIMDLIRVVLFRTGAWIKLAEIDDAVERMCVSEKFAWFGEGRRLRSAMNELNVDELDLVKVFALAAEVFFSKSRHAISKCRIIGNVSSKYIFRYVQDMPVNSAIEIEKLIADAITSNCERDLSELVVIGVDVE